MTILKLSNFEKIAVLKIAVVIWKNSVVKKKNDLNFKISIYKF